jgi:two-component system cell cycle sensor histidine kinase/response regulator CckA
VVTRQVSNDRGSGSRSGGRAPRPTLLVVEDDDTVRAFVVRCLQGHGYQVISCETGRQAVDALWSAGFSIDLVLADVVLPDLRGPELLGLALGACPGVRMRFMSGCSLVELQEDGLDADESTFLPKPFRTNDLLEFVDRSFALATS